jgi:predicted RNA-binding Zn-ribbon protein involved in translation (DUF1610 family)
LSNRHAQREEPMPTAKLDLVLKPDSSRMTLLEVAVTPAMTGDGDTDYTCPGCDAIVISRIQLGQVDHLVFRCARCGTYGAVPKPTN